MPVDAPVNHSRWRFRRELAANFCAAFLSFYWNPFIDLFCHYNAFDWTLELIHAEIQTQLT